MGNVESSDLTAQSSPFSLAVQKELRLFDDYVSLPRMDFTRPEDITNAIMARLHHANLLTDAIIEHLLSKEETIQVTKKDLEIRMQDLHMTLDGLDPAIEDVQVLLEQASLAYSRWYRRSGLDVNKYMSDDIEKEILRLKARSYNHRFKGVY